MIEVTPKDIDALIAIEPRFKTLYDNFGLLKKPSYHGLYEGIIKTIMSQQLSTKSFLTQVSKMDPQIFIDPLSLRTALENHQIKLPSSKLNTLTALANDFISGKLNEDKLSHMTSEQLNAILTQYKGIGPWSCQMINIFCLHKKDIFAYSDYGVKKGLCYLYGLNFRHTDIDTYVFYGKKFGNSSTVACLYLWKLNEIKQEEIDAAKRY